MHSLLEFDKEEDMTVNTSKVLFKKPAEDLLDVKDILKVRTAAQETWG